MANGVAAYIALGGTVRELINPRGPRITEAPATLRVFRAFEGQKIPVTYEGPEILTLVLLPGDVVTW